MTKKFLTILFALFCLLISHNISAQINNWKHGDSVYHELSKKFDEVYMQAPFFIVNNGGKKNCLLLDEPKFKIDTIYESVNDSANGGALKIHSIDTLQILNSICFFEKGKTAVYYYYQFYGDKTSDSLYAIIPLGKYSELYFPTAIGTVDLLDIRKPVHATEKLDYIVVKSKGKYDAYLFNGDLLSSRTKKFPQISSKFIHDEDFWRLKREYEHVHRMMDMYVVNSGGKIQCQELPVQDSTIMFLDFDPGSGMEKEIALDYPIIQEICFFDGGETGILLRDYDSLLSVLPTGDHDEIFLRLNTGTIDILADPKQYDFSKDSLAFVFPQDEISSEYFYDYIISSTKGKYSAHNYEGEQFIENADVIYGKIGWLLLKNDSLYEVDEKGNHIPQQQYYEVPENNLFPMNILSSSDTMLWNAEADEHYPKHYYGNAPFHYQWRDWISGTTQIYSKTGNIKLEEDSLMDCFYGRRKKEPFVSIDSKDFGMADFYNNILLEDLSSLSAWGMDKKDSLINVPVGSREYFRIKHTVQYLTAQKKDEHLLIDLKGRIVKSSKEPIKILFKKKGWGECEYVYEVE